jgi:hypothetical protein
LDSFNAETGQNRKKFGWILVESSPPYDSGVVECPPEALDIGRTEWTDAINSYYTALTTDTWLSPLHTGFSDVPVQIGLPEWYGKASRASR